MQTKRHAVWIALLLACVFGFAVCRVQAAALSAKALPVPLTGLVTDSEDDFPGQLSPDGRWLAYFCTQGKKRYGLRVYEMATSHAWFADLQATTSDDAAPSKDVLVWRPDCQVCAVGVSQGWSVVTPQLHQVTWIDHAHGTNPIWESCAAWSPRTKRLAIFGGLGDFRVWDGQKMHQGANWSKASGAPYWAAERAWQCEWSPNEKSLLLRFYGESERQRAGAGHMMILDSNTGHKRYQWGTEAGQAHWLDNAHLAYRGDDDSLGGFWPVTLQEGYPAKSQERTLLAEVVDWALSPKRDTLWAVTGKGDLFRTRTAKAHWQRVWHTESARSRPMDASSARLCISQDGSHVTLATDNAVAVLATQSGPIRKWIRPGMTMSVLGWTAGQNLPLLAVRRTFNGPWGIWQLEQTE